MKAAWKTSCSWFCFSRLIPLLVCLFMGEQGASAEAPRPAGPVKAEIRRTDDRYQLYVAGKPFYVKGAGLEFGSQEKLAEHGGNCFRTWRTENGRNSGHQVLDRAIRNRLYVVMGLDLGRERHGFDYSDPRAVSRQFEEIRRQVLEYKDHPALIVWAIGNELNLEARNPMVWDAVNEISEMIHRLDGNHLTTTPLAGLNRDLVAQIKTRCPDLDFLSVQMYADIINLPRYLRESGWEGPYMITEWGATGHWEVGKTEWGAPLENDSTTKADFYRMRFETVIRTDRRQCLGSFVFLWGQKQERTPTWYGMFLESGEETETVDVLHFLWNGTWPANRSPRIEAVWLDGRSGSRNIRLKPGQTCLARVSASDPDADPLTYQWEVMEESGDLGTGGDFEKAPARLPGLVMEPNRSEVSLQAPSGRGAYRLFVYVRDGRGHAGHANIPFFVEP